MKTITKKVIFIVSVVLVLVVLASCARDVGARSATTVQRWEYYVFKFNNVSGNESLARINELGEEGWELVSVANYPRNHDRDRLYFKRPLP